MTFMDEFLAEAKTLDGIQALGDLGNHEHEESCQSFRIRINPLTKQPETSVWRCKDFRHCSNCRRERAKEHHAYISNMRYRYGTDEFLYVVVPKEKDTQSARSRVAFTKPGFIRYPMDDETIFIIPNINGAEGYHPDAMIMNARNITIDWVEANVTLTAEGENFSMRKPKTAEPHPESPEILFDDTEQFKAAVFGSESAESNEELARRANGVHRAPEPEPEPCEEKDIIYHEFIIPDGDIGRTPFSDIWAVVDQRTSDLAPDFYTLQRAVTLVEQTLVGVCEEMGVHIHTLRRIHMTLRKDHRICWDQKPPG
jgi:hypothetical protein